MGRAPCCEKVGLKRGPWTPEEDQKLIAYVNENGHGSWRALPKKAGLLRCGKSCRLRWTNYLRPDIKRGEFSPPEEQTIIQLHALLGNRWSAIASHLPKRTDNEIKNYWNTHLKKKLMKMGLDPCTHKPAMDNTLMSSNAEPDSNAEAGTESLLLKVTNCTNSGSSTSHMAQWESARLEAESRLKQESQLRAKGLWRAGLAAGSPMNVTPLSARTPWSATFRSEEPSNSSAVCADALKALGAVELMQALHNWEKSLQGQAGMLWPEAWRLPGVHFGQREAQGESSSCSSHCSDANTSTSPMGAAGPRRLDHLSPTSTLCSLDSHSIKQKALHPSIVSNSHSEAHIRKLSWSDALAPLPPKLDMPASLPLSKVVSGYNLHGVSCKMEEDSSTFSSLMQDAVFGTDSMYMACLEESASALSNLEKDAADEGVDRDVRGEACGGMGSNASTNTLDVKVGDACEGATKFAAGEEGGCEKDSEERMGNYEDGNCGAMLECESISEDTNMELSSEAITCDACVSENVSGALLSETNVEGAVDDGTVDLSNNGIDDSKKDDEDDSDDGKEMASAEVFKDLPKLKSEVLTPRLTSYCALLSDEIPDYWSSIMMKEPNLQQVDMTF